MTTSIKTTAVFLRPFQLPSFNETLPAGEYEIETQLPEPVDWLEPGTWTSSVLVRLHPRASHPGLSRTLTVPLAELEHAVAKDKLTGKALTDFFLEEMLADPMIRLVMQADGVAEDDLRDLYSTQSDRRPAGEDAASGPQEPLMTDGAINLDGRRSATDQRDSEMRRRPANSQSPSKLPPRPQLESLEDQMLAEPARTWDEVMEKWHRLLDRYAATPEAGDERVQKFIKCALGDMARLRMLEERK